MNSNRFGLLLAVIVVLLAVAAGSAVAQDEGAGPEKAAPAETSKRMLDFIKAGGPVGYLIILLSIVGIALVIEGFLHIKADKLLPQTVCQHSEQLASKGRFSELLALCQADNSMLGRILRGALSQGQLGIAAVRDAMLEGGTREMTRLRQRVGYIGFIASVAPMLGLLGTVTGMISSFNVLGMEKGAARPDELAKGISEALVTTCMGLVLAVPLMFFHNYFRDRLTRIGHEASGLCERLLRLMTAVMEARTAPHGGGPAGPARE